MSNQIIAVPSESDAGLATSRSDHFGHTKLFTIVTMNDKGIAKVESLANLDHQPGGCGRVVQLLQEHQVDTVIAGGMGNGPFQKLQKAGIKVLFADSVGFPDVQAAIDGLLAGKLTPMEMRQLCKGGGNCHHKEQA